MDDPLASLVANYPAHKSEIELRFHTEPSFQELCRDYLLLQRLVERLQTAPVDSADRMRCDYRKALEELETELHLILGIAPDQEENE